jgi:hypothetical protein
MARGDDHEVSILISPWGACAGEHPGSKVSMMIMRPPQHGHGCPAETRGHRLHRIAAEEQPAVRSGGVSAFLLEPHQLLHGLALVKRLG